ncbi:HD domain-containing protein [Paenibacillus contaminans]|uniref:GTP pyrophosphokinase n=1 Tax=Paenibacillus contaminans TaxID=450362 RepID=A0A329MIY3_9BACL|nr:HD domain-containing protein [Paenibacillus contaminans]RAV19622.1 GTP pyrophosphokinase [Paenibacillus contaminans]
MSTLEKAIALAAQAHAGQTDKGGNPYILHPLRVMMKLQTNEERIAAVFHDLFEDTTVTPQDLEEKSFTREIIDAVHALTKNKDESYDEFIARAKNNSIARNVKIADIEDNMDLSRIPDPAEKDYARVERYRRALKELLS